MAHVATRSVLFGDVREHPGKSSLFLLIQSFVVSANGQWRRPWNSFTEREGRAQKQSRPTFGLSGACSRTLENPNGGFITTLAPLAVLITATGLQDEKSLVNRTM